MECRRLKYNHISAIPSGVFQNQAHLKILCLDKNEIMVIESETFNGLNSLVWLMLGDNIIQDFPLAELRYLQSLEILDISSNLLTLENDKFPHLLNLSEM